MALSQLVPLRKREEILQDEPRGDAVDEPLALHREHGPPPPHRAKRPQCGVGRAAVQQPTRPRSRVAFVPPRRRNEHLRAAVRRGHVTMASARGTGSPAAVSLIIRAPATSVGARRDLHSRCARAAGRQARQHACTRALPARPARVATPTRCRRRHGARRDRARAPEAVAMARLREDTGTRMERGTPITRTFGSRLLPSPSATHDIASTRNATHPSRRGARPAETAGAPSARLAASARRRSRR